MFFFIVDAEQSKVHLQDADAVAKAFASACIAAGESCALAKGNRFTSPSTLLAAIDRLLDELYKRPIPALHLNIPTVITPSTIRSLFFRGLYSVSKWGVTAERH